VFNLSKVLNETETLLKPRMHVRVNLDVDISYEEATFIKDTFVNDYSLRELTLIPVKRDLDGDIALPGDIKFLSVDQIVSDQISQINSDHFDPKLLLEIYRAL
jgi:hypothetical protein